MIQDNTSKDFERGQIHAFGYPPLMSKGVNYGGAMGANTKQDQWVKCFTSLESQHICKKIA